MKKNSEFYGFATLVALFLVTLASVGCGKFQAAQPIEAGSLQQALTELEVGVNTELLSSAQITVFQAAPGVGADAEPVLRQGAPNSHKALGLALQANVSNRGDKEVVIQVKQGNLPFVKVKCGLSDFVVTEEIIDWLTDSDIVRVALSDVCEVGHESEEIIAERQIAFEPRPESEGEISIFPGEPVLRQAAPNNNFGIPSAIQASVNNRFGRMLVIQVKENGAFGNLACGTADFVSSGDFSRLTDGMLVRIVLSDSCDGNASGSTIVHTRAIELEEDTTPPPPPPQATAEISIFQGGQENAEPVMRQPAPNNFQAANLSIRARVYDRGNKKVRLELRRGSDKVELECSSSDFLVSEDITYLTDAHTVRVSLTDNCASNSSGDMEIEERAIEFEAEETSLPTAPVSGYALITVFQGGPDAEPVARQPAPNSHQAVNLVLQANVSGRGNKFVKLEVVRGADSFVAKCLAADWVVSNDINWLTDEHTVRVSLKANCNSNSPGDSVIAEREIEFE